MTQYYNEVGDIDYKISNSIRCDIPSRTVYNNDWRYNANDEGWEFGFNVADLSFLGGSMHGVRRNGAQIAYVEQPFSNVGVVPSTNYIELVLRVKSRYARTAKLQFIKQNNNDDDPAVIDSLGQYIEFDLITDGSWHLYRLDPNVLESWQGIITRLRLFPFIEGIANDEFYVQFIRIIDVSVETAGCACTLDDFFTNVPSPCTGAGRAASIIGSSLNSSRLAVSNDNNSFEISINGTEFRTIYLDKTSIDTSILAVVIDMERKLNMVATPGFMNATVELQSDNKIRISGGIRGDDTSIEIKYSKLFEQLGFFDRYQTPLYSFYEGVTDDNLFEGIFELNNESLRILKDSSVKSSVTFNPEQYLIEGGNPLYSFNYYTDPFVMKNITLIDYLKPITNNGKIDKGYFYGTLLQSPVSKLKIFRPIGDNMLKFIGEIEITPDIIINNPKVQAPPLPFNQVLRDFEVELSLDVQAGDLIGVSNVIVYSYAQFGEPALLTYMKVLDDVTYDLNINDDVIFYGNGMKSLPVYVRSNGTRDKARLFFDFGQKTAIDKVVFDYKPSEIVKVGANVSSSMTDITVDTKGGSHGYWRYIPTYSGLEQISNTKTTLAKNIELLTDGVRTSFGGSDDSYFYLDGDGQIGNTDYVDPGHPSSGSFATDKFDIIIDISPDFEKEIGAIALYFVEPLNWVEYGLFYENGGKRIPFDLKTITFDDRPVSPGSAFYMNPLIAVTEDDETSSDVQTIIRLSTAIASKRKALYVVQPVKTKRVVLEVYRHFSTKMTEIELFSPELVSSTGFNIVGSDIFSVFTAGDDLVFEQIDFSVDNTVEGREINTSFMTIGKPINYAVVEIRPPLIFDLYSVKFLSEKIDDHTPRVNEEYINSTTESTEISVSYDETRTITVKNDSTSTADLVVDILQDDTYDTHNVVFYSSLSSHADIINPKRGVTGLYKFTGDKELKIRYDVLKNKPAWGAYNYNFLYPRNTVWTSLGTSLTDSSLSANIYAPVGAVESNHNAPANYQGEVESGGTYTQTYDTEYTVHIDITNGALPESGETLSPTFTVTSVPDVDDVATPVVIEHINTFYPVGTKGVNIRFNTFTQFGDEDIFIINAFSASQYSGGVNAKTYGYVAFDLGQFFRIDSTSIVATTEMITRDTARSWKNDPDLFANSGNRINNIDNVIFNSFGNLDSLARWVMISWDFSQGSRGGWLNKVSAFVEESPFYSNRWWDVSSADLGAADRNTYVISSDNNSGSSLRLTYNSNQTEEVLFTIKEDATWEADPLWSFRDFLNFNIFLENKENIDYLIVRMGTDSSNYFEWSISPSLLENSSWVPLSLQFKNASIIEKPELYTSIGFFQIALKGLGSSSPTYIYLDSPLIKRNKFDDIVKFNKGVYLNGDEFISFFPIENLTLSKGSIEFWFNPDYDSEGYFENIESLEEVPEVGFQTIKSYKYYYDDRIFTHSLLSIVTGVDFYATVGVQTSFGGLLFYTNNSGSDEIRTINSVEFDWYTPHHIGVTWKYSIDTLTLEMRLYVDGIFVKQLFTPWQSACDSNLNIILGGAVDPDMFIIRSDSACASFESLKISNYFKSDFTDFNESFVDIDYQVKNNDLFSIAINGGGFNQYGAGVFPLRIKNVGPGDTVELGVQFNRPSDRKIPKTLSRKSRVDFKWELK